MTLLGWSEHDLGVPGQVLPVVTASHPVLSAASERVDAADPKVTQLAAAITARLASRVGKPMALNR